jgi:hypothetical protein
LDAIVVSKLKYSPKLWFFFWSIGERGLVIFFKNSKRGKTEVLLSHWNTMVLLYFCFRKDEVPNGA